MSEEGNLSNRLITSAKDLTRSSTGLSALLIFITLLILGVAFGLRFQPQPTYNFQVASSNDDLNSSKINLFDDHEINNIQTLTKLINDYLEAIN